MPGTTRVGSRLLKKVTPKGRFGRSVTLLAGGTMAGQAITAASMPLVTRLYTPAQIGVISVFLSFFSVWAYLLSWRYESALLIAESDLESHHVFRLGVICVVVSSALSFPVLRALRDTQTLGFGILPWWAPYSAIPILVGYGLYMLYRYWALRGEIPKPIAYASMARNAANAVTRVVTGFLGFGVSGLFIAEVIGSCSPAGVLNRKIAQRYSESKPRHISLPQIVHVFKKYSKYVKYELPSVAINQAGLAAPVPIIAALFGASAAGWFGLARLLVAIPNAQLGKALADTFQMEFAACIRAGKFSQARALFYKLLKRLSLLGIIPYACIMIAAPWLVPYIFGDDWSTMGIITTIISPWMYASLVVGSLSRLISVVQAQEYKLIYDFVVIALLVGVYFLSKQNSFGLYFTTGLLAGAGIIAYAVYLAIILWVVQTKCRGIQNGET